MKIVKCLLFVVCLPIACIINAQQGRTNLNFNKNWKFKLGDNGSYKEVGFKDEGWLMLSLPHDWSIEGKFDSINPAGNAGGALPGGVGWYRKEFITPADLVNNGKCYIAFDGIYRNSEVWINEKYLGKWPYGYTSFRYELTPYLKQGCQKNTIAVRVDNAQQPNSRWYSGSGIYRNVRLITTGPVSIDEWGVFVTTPVVSKEKALVNVAIDFEKPVSTAIQIETLIIDAAGKTITGNKSNTTAGKKQQQKLEIQQPKFWSIDTPYLYKLVTNVYDGTRLVDSYTVPFGIRYFEFDAAKGFFLNGKPMKILGVCMHHDLGALGAAFNVSAARRQLRILKEMGTNAIRVAHNPPAPEFLDLCDQMGFLVMDESFDMWAKKKNKFDYYSDFPEWHQRDLEHMVKRDRNHPSVFMWSIGNEIREQFDSSGIRLAREFVKIVKNQDSTRPVTCALSENNPDKNFIYQSKALDVVGLNYHIEAYKDFPKNYRGEKFIATENVSGLASRGHYDMPSDSLRLWPSSSKFKYVEKGNPDYTVSAYDNVAAYWGSSHEQTWRIIKTHDYLSGLFVWSGFDFLGEPVPYPYPARSSYYGIVDLAGFPKDVYYMYQSEWTAAPMLHLFPHWNWKKGNIVDVMAYYNGADAVELFLNGRSLGKKQKPDTAFHVTWRVSYEPGTLKAVSTKNGGKIAEQIIHTAGAPDRIELSVENRSINTEKDELSFVTIRVLDKAGNLVPDAGNLVEITTNAQAAVVAMDNGYPADLTPFQQNSRKVYNGLALVIIKGLKPGKAIITASAPGLKKASTSITVQ